MFSTLLHKRLNPFRTRSRVRNASDTETLLQLACHGVRGPRQSEAAMKVMETDKVTPMKENKDKHLAKEFDLFDATGQRTTNIDLLLEALKSIPPTSVESDRSLSAAGLFVTKLRTRLSDGSVDQLCLLKSHYRSQQI